MLCHQREVRMTPYCWRLRLPHVLVRPSRVMNWPNVVLELAVHPNTPHRGPSVRLTAAQAKLAVHLSRKAQDIRLLDDHTRLKGSSVQSPIGEERWLEVAAGSWPGQYCSPGQSSQLSEVSVSRAVRIVRDIHDVAWLGIPRHRQCCQKRTDHLIARFGRS